MRLVVLLALLAALSSAGAEGVTLPFGAASEGCATSVTGPNLRAFAAGAGAEACSVVQRGEMSAVCQGDVCTLFAVGSAIASAGVLPGLNEVEMSIQSQGATPGILCAAEAFGDGVECSGAAFVSIPLSIGVCAPVHVSSWFVQDQPLPEGDWRTALASASVTSSATVCHEEDGPTLSAP